MPHPGVASMDIVSALGSALAATVGGMAGPRIIRAMNHAFDEPVEDLPPFPIVLKPYRWIAAVYLVCGFMFSAAVIFVAWMILVNGRSLRDSPAWSNLLDLPSVILGALCLLLVLMSAAKRIVLEEDKLTYRRWGKTEVLDFHDIAIHEVVVGYVTIQRRSDGSTLKIPLEFRNIRYLNETLKRWFVDLGRKHHCVYPR